MKMTVTYGEPLTHAEILLEALGPLCDKEKNNELNSKLKEMKMHIGKLPNAMIMTLSSGSQDFIL